MRSDKMVENMTRFESVLKWTLEQIYILSLPDAPDYDGKNRDIKRLTKQAKSLNSRVENLEILLGIRNERNKS